MRKPVPASRRRADEQVVALALVDVLGPEGVGEAVGPQPRQVQRALRGAFLVPEACPEHPAVHHGGAVGREDHVGQSADGLHDVHDVPQVAVEATELLPLGQGEGGVDGLAGFHPRIDGVGDVEMAGRAHQQTSADGGAGGFGHDVFLSTVSGFIGPRSGGHAEAMAIPIGIVRIEREE